MICQEFPLKKAENNQSTNIDWLMYNTQRKQLLFVELKTSDTSINSSQNEIYQSVTNDIQNKSGAFLISDLEILRVASRESGKYQFILEKKVSRFKQEISICRSAKIIYIDTNVLKTKQKNMQSKCYHLADYQNQSQDNFQKNGGLFTSISPNLTT